MTLTQQLRVALTLTEALGDGSCPHTREVVLREQDGVLGNGTKFTHVASIGGRDAHGLSAEEAISKLIQKLEAHVRSQAAALRMAADTLESKIDLQPSKAGR